MDHWESFADSTFSSACDTCDTNLTIGDNWFHKPGSVCDLCRIHCDDLRSKEQSSYIAIDDASKLGEDAEVYRDEDKGAQI